MAMAGSHETLHAIVVDLAPGDGLEVRRALERDGIAAELRVVGPGAALRAAIDEGPVDLVICGHAPPALDAAEALALVRAQRLDLPFIVVSEPVGEEVVVDLVRAGAADYVLKGNLARLPIAVRRAVRDALERRQRARDREQHAVAERFAATGALAGALVPQLGAPLTRMLFDLELTAVNVARLTAAAPVGAGVPAGNPQLAAIDARLTGARDVCAELLGLVTDIDRFGRGEGERRAGLAECLESALRLAACLLDTCCRVEPILEPVPAVALSPHRLSQLLLTVLVGLTREVPEGTPGAHTLTIRGGAAFDAAELVLDLRGPGVAAQPRALWPLVRRAVAEAGGQLELEAGGRAAVRARLRLPLARPEPASDGGARATVLVVDDDAALRDGLGMILGEEYQVVTADSAEQALRAIEAQHIDVVVSDMYMRGRTGLDLYRELLDRHPRLARTCVLVSGGDHSSTMLATLATFRDRFIEKPFDPEVLLGVVARLVR